PGVMAKQAFSPGMDPIPALTAAALLRDFNGERRAVRVCELGIKLIVVPDVCVGAPGRLFQVKDLRLDTPPAGGLARRSLDGSRARQHRPIWEPPVALVVERDFGRAGYSQHPLGGRAV